MSSLRIRSEPSPRSGTPCVAVTPESAGWEYVGFEVHTLQRGQEHTWKADGREICVVLLSGLADVRAGAVTFGGIGGRSDVFDGRPHAVYSPTGSHVHVRAVSGRADVAVCWAPAPASALAPAHITPEHIAVERRGVGTAERQVHPILMQDKPAERLLVVEVLTPAGHWSSFPPHKHDRDDLPRESRLEETYYHRVRPERGFAVQRVYTDDRSLDETITVGDGDVVLVPRGYHTVSAPPGYDLYYLNVMAGPTRDWQFVDDPDHAWLQPGPAPS